MSGLGSEAFTAPVTRERMSRLRFDISYYAQVEPPVVFQREGVRMVRSPLVAPEHVLYLRGIGWQLRSFQDEVSYMVERSDGQGGILTDADVTKAGGLFSVNQHRSPSDLPGATTGGSGSLAVNADPHWEKRVGDGENWDASTQKLTADETAYPPPEPSEANILADRVIVGKTNESTDQANTLAVRMFYPSTTASVVSVLHRIYFVGPAGSTPDDVGNGNYCAVFYASGFATLYEQIKEEDGAVVEPPTWKRRWSFLWADSHEAAIGKWHMITIRMSGDPRADTTSPGGTILFIVSSSKPSTTPIFAQQVGTETKNGIRYYRIPRNLKRFGKGWQGQASQAAPVRVDVRRDARVKIQLSRARYFPSGTLTDDAFSLEFFPTTRTNMFLRWQADVPSGTTLDAVLYDAKTRTALTLISSTADYKEYECPTFGNRTFYVKFTFTSATGEKTPTLYRYSVSRQGWNDLVNNGEREGGTLMAVEQTDGSPLDNTYENTRVILRDPKADLGDLLLVRDAIPYIIDTEYTGVDFTNPANDGLQSVIAQGFTSKFAGRLKGRGDSGKLYPSPDWVDYEGNAESWFRLLQDAKVSHRTNFQRDPTDPEGRPWFVVDAIRQMLAFAGVRDGDIDLPTTAEAPIRLFPIASEQGWLVDPFSAVPDLVQKLCYNYLGGYMIFDPNASTEVARADWRGMWRFRWLPKPPYAILAQFNTDRAATGKLPHVDGAYGTVMVGSQEVKQAFITRDSIRKTPVKPEANLIVVSGSGALDAPELGKTTAIAVNPLSYNFYTTVTANPTHPDYLGRVVPLGYFDKGLGADINSIRWVLRRLADVTFYGTDRITLSGPLLLVTDVTDTEQVRPRKLRFGDPVAVDATTYIVQACHPTVKKDHVQMATYELKRPVGPFAP